jgi:hypothetical protein
VRRAAPGAPPHALPVVDSPLADELAAVLGKFDIDAAKHLLVG